MTILRSHLTSLLLRYSVLTAFGAASLVATAGPSYAATKKADPKAAPAKKADEKKAEPKKADEKKADPKAAAGGDDDYDAADAASHDAKTIEAESRDSVVSAQANAAAKVEARRDPALIEDIEESLEVALHYQEKEMFVAGTDQMDYKAMLDEALTESKRKHDILVGQQPKRKAALAAAKSTYVTSSKSMGQWVKDQKNALKKWARDETVRVKGIKDKKARQAADGARKDQERAKNSTLKTDIAGRKGTLKTAWKKAQTIYRKFRDALSKTAAEMKQMPKYAKKMRPQLLRALSKLNGELGALTSGAATEGANAAGSLATLAALNPDVIKFYLKYRVFEKVAPRVDEGIETSLSKTFNVMDKVVAAIIRAIAAAVGAVPFVGGVLAAAASAAGQAIYTKVKNTVMKSIRKLGKRLTERLSTSIGGQLFAAVTTNQPLAQAIAAAARSAAVEATKGIVAASKVYDADATRAEAEPDTALKDAVADGHEMAKEHEANEKDMAGAEVAAEGGGAPAEAKAEKAADKPAAKSSKKK